MKRVSLSDRQVSPSEIWSFYEASRRSLREEKSALLEAIIDGGGVPEEYLGMSRSEVEEIFGQHQSELELLISLDLLASMEATICADYYLRSQEKRKDSLSRQLRSIHKRETSTGCRAGYEKILKIWREEKPGLNRIINEFHQAMDFRHWIAHGRYWVPKLGREYTPEDVFAITEELMEALSSLS
jgi:hypothetical protein